MTAIASRRELIRDLASRNTSPDGAGGDDVLYGPGVRIELTPGQDPVTQMLVTISEEEIGWMVLGHLMKSFQWKLLDPTTGRELNPNAEG